MKMAARNLRPLSMSEARRAGLLLKEQKGGAATVKMRMLGLFDGEDDE